MKRLPILALLLLLIAVGATVLTRFSNSVSAEDFRMETDVFAETSADPIVETLTIFRGQVIYDFMGSKGEEITILNIPRGSLVLLDTRRKLQTTITTSQLMAFTAAVKSAATSTDQSRLVAPQFQETYDSANQVLTLSDVQLTYRVEAIKPQHPDCARRFQLFADWYARLNATRVGNPPPFGRIELNRSLAKRGLIPAQIERTVGPTTSPDRQQKMRSRHLTNWQLTDTDRKRIHRAEEYCKHFQKVTADRYWQTEPLPPGKPATD